MMHQSMSGRAVQTKIDMYVASFAAEMRDEKLSLSQAHELLKSSGLNLFAVAALAKVIACFQCSAD